MGRGSLDSDRDMVLCRCVQANGPKTDVLWLVRGLFSAVWRIGFCRAIHRSVVAAVVAADVEGMLYLRVYYVVCILQEIEEGYMKG